MVSHASSHTHSAPAARSGPTIGFDLDMTLIDSRPGIHAAYVELAARTGVHIDADLAITRLGPPLAEELAHWFPEDEVPAMADRYRALYPSYAVPPTLPMPGAREAIAAVQEARGTSVVVTAKHEGNAKQHLEHLDIRPDAVIGELWAEGKAQALLAHGATAYVGDHIGDVRGARTAGVISVAVATGPCSADELRAAGADTVLPDLTAFPAWLKANGLNG
ncbi:HAD family hydrolase [Streptomyces iconiensis]|uniref:HAD hydrolase-like protein n=1 Tax=Streptomyces iconiensis TaxID=1384038 RepID=A0ABT7ABY5_9ACTN|nr:HAD hydrolase-like protein [Streptomyces iconiensis]MDJ1138148.1 HAD hydrolase-like protein [Streptomyces iconiensis]